MTEQSETHFAPEAVRRGRLMAAIMMLVLALPLVAAIVVYRTGIGMPAGTANEGVLLTPPQPIEQLALVEHDSTQPWDIRKERARWRLLVPALAGCDDQCKQNLYLTRQVHVRLAKDAYRMERFILLGQNEPVDAEFEEFLQREHPGLRTMRVSEDRLTELLAATNLATSQPDDEGHYYLMDQRGFVMMAYHREHTGNQLLADIKRMLKVTYEG